MANSPTLPFQGIGIKRNQRGQRAARTTALPLRKLIFGLRLFRLWNPHGVERAIDKDQRHHEDERADGRLVTCSFIVTAISEKRGTISDVLTTKDSTRFSG